MDTASRPAPARHGLAPFQTSHQLQLPSKQPNFPLSSPITEEIKTPSSWSSGKASTLNRKDPFSSPLLAEDNPFADNESGDTSGQDEFALERYSEDLKRRNPERRNSTQRSARSNSVKGRAGQTLRKERPGLNVVTNFSRNAQRSWTDGAVMENQASNRTGMQLASNAAPFVNLDDLKSLARQQKEKMPMGIKSKNKESGGLGLKDQRERPNPRTYTNLGADEPREAPSKGDKARNALRDFLQAGRERRARPENPAINGLKRSDTRVHELSPSDRPIMIGITIPEHEYNSRATNQGAEQAQSQVTPATPSIVITPAHDNAPWVTSAEHSVDSKRKPTSSVYSQPFDFNAPMIGLPDAPPVPAIPRDRFPVHAKVPMSSSETQEVDRSRESVRFSSGRQRSFSEGTLFDEDDSPQVVTRSRSSSNESKQGILKRTSTDTLTTRPQSKGWWNLMLSPMLSRSNTIASRMTQAEEKERPPLPSLTTAAELAQRYETADDKSLDDHFSPETPRRIGMKSGVTNWSRWSDWERARDLRETASPAETSREESPIQAEARPQEQPQVLHKAQDSAATVPFMISSSPVIEGAAAEYFQACAHDMISPEPYFECINHSCKLKTLAREPEQVAFDEFLRAGNRGLDVNEEPKDTPNTEVIEPKGEEAGKPFSQTPANRFSAAFREATHQRDRSDSDSTIIEEDEPEMSPIVRKANAAPVLRARPPIAAVLPPAEEHVESAGPITATNPTPAPEPERAPEPISREASNPAPEPRTAPIPPAYSPPRKITRFPAYTAILPPDRQPASPGPISPAMQRSMSQRGGIPMSEVGGSTPATAPTFITNNHYNYPEVVPPRQRTAPVSLAEIQRPVAVRENADAKRQRLEKEDATAKKSGVLWRGRGCFGRAGPEGRKRRRWYLMITAGLVSMIILVVVLAITLTRKGDHTPVQSQWLNLTGFPSMPTGVLTIAQPDAAVENTGCIQPSTMWSCALPKEQQPANAPNDPDQPNFRIEIRFRNGTFHNSTASAPNATKRSVTSHSLFRSPFLQKRDPFTDALYDPSPAPPSTNEQIFLGNTTDNVTAPFQGEATPFFISFVSSTAISPSSRLLKRQGSSNSTNSSTSFPDLSNLIPSPSTDSDGTAAAATLLPFPSSQPVRLYNRGQDTEHYGFYSYFDRSIFLKTTSPLNATFSGDNDDTIPDDQNGGSPKNAASVRCTWAQTRFLVQIWTSPSAGMAVLPQSANNTKSSSHRSKTSANSSATDLTRPGSFPYPVSVTLDRHGGDEDRKMVYCYGIDNTQHVVSSAKALQLEDRGSGGTVINPAAGLFNVTDPRSDGGDEGAVPGWKGAGGVDGGTGGCACQWRNWVQSN